MPGYEDVWYYLWRERKLPINVDPLDARLDDELERDAPAPRLRRRASTRRSATRCRSRATTAPAGALAHGPWYLRGDRCYLIPGDSPIGYRLPLDSLPWVTKPTIHTNRARSVRAMQRLAGGGVAARANAPHALGHAAATAMYLAQRSLSRSWPFETAPP